MVGALSQQGRNIAMFQGIAECLFLLCLIAEDYGSPSDVWVVGLILYKLLAGHGKWMPVAREIDSHQSSEGKHLGPARSVDFLTFLWSRLRAILPSNWLFLWLKPQLSKGSSLVRLVHQELPRSFELSWCDRHHEASLTVTYCKAVSKVVLVAF